MRIHHNRHALGSHPAALEHDGDGELEVDGEHPGGRRGRAHEPAARQESGEGDRAAACDVTVRDLECEDLGGVVAEAAGAGLDRLAPVIFFSLVYKLTGSTIIVDNHSVMNNFGFIG